jgi:hypothetical protein
VIERATLAMFHPREELPLRCTVALQFIRDDDAWNVLTPFEQLAKELLRGFLVPLTLYEDIEDIVVLIHRAPEVVPFAMNCQKDLVQVPFVARARPSAPQPIGVVLATLPTPLADGFMGHRDTAFQQQFLHVAVAQGEARVEPDPVADDFPRKAVMLVARGVGRRGHAWLPIHRFI